MPMRHVAAALTLALACVACAGGTDAPSERIAVPRLVGMTTETATATVTGNDLCVGRIAWGAYTPAMAGRVLAQEPPPGRRVERWASVSITVAPATPIGDIVDGSGSAGCAPATIVFPQPG
jgi:beta-lactam-binding protein with PASTA domain